MRYPTLTELPPPPLDKIGWPWTEETPPLPETMPNGSPWPRISIVTPSYNQGQFIEETIRSVLLQGYPNLEYTIIDGGSKDGSVEIIRKYEPWLAYWVSEKDRGQSHAINKGFRIATGTIFAWINSDDQYKPNVFKKVAYQFSRNPEIALLYSKTEVIDELSTSPKIVIGNDYCLEKMLVIGNQIPQPSAFFTAQIFNSVGGLNEKYGFSMDYDLWLKIGLLRKVQFLDDVWSRFRLHINSKSNSEKVKFDLENYEIIRRVLFKCPHFNFRKIICINIIKVAQAYQKNGDGFQAYRWAMRAFVNNPLIAWQATSLRSDFYTLILGRKLKRNISKLLYGSLEK